MDRSILDKYIIGRVEPQIYAFTTGTVPNYLKVGDTYRPIDQRLNEWRRYFPDLEKAYSAISKVDQDVYYRDFAIHYYLEHDKRLHRLLPSDMEQLPYYSREFFEHASDKMTMTTSITIVPEYIIRDESIGRRNRRSR